MFHCHSVVDEKHSFISFKLNKKNYEDSRVQCSVYDTPENLSAPKSVKKIRFYKSKSAVSLMYRSLKYHVEDSSRRIFLNAVYFLKIFISFLSIYPKCR